MDEYTFHHFTSKRGENIVTLNQMSPSFGKLQHNQLLKQNSNFGLTCTVGKFSRMKCK